MGRRYKYYCDNCGKDFNDTNHVNMKSGQIYYSEVTHSESNNPKATEWKQHPILNGNEEKLFCNGKCFGEFITNHTPKEMVFGTKFHTFAKGICLHCGCSEVAVQEFNWDCKQK